MLRADNDPEAEVIMDVAGQEAQEDHDGCPEDTGIGNLYQFNTKKRGYSQVKDLFNEILMDVGENPSLLKEVFERSYEHVAKPIFEKIALLNAADNGVGGIRSLSSVNEGLPPQSGRYKPAWEIGLESHGSQRGKRRDTSEREKAEELESERLKKKSLKHKDPFVLSPSTSVNQQRVPKLIADKNTVKTVSDRSLSDRLRGSPATATVAPLPTNGNAKKDKLRDSTSSAALSPQTGTEVPNFRVRVRVRATSHLSTSHPSTSPTHLPRPSQVLTSPIPGAPFSPDPSCSVLSPS